MKIQKLWTVKSWEIAKNDKFEKKFQMILRLYTITWK